MSSDNAKPRAAAGPHLEWQSELDSAMAAIDDRLTHPRRRASDKNSRAVLPEQLGDTPITNELLDEIAWRVAQQMRRKGQAATAEAVGTALTQPHPAVQPPALAPGKMVMIRFRVPDWWLFRFLRRFRKKQHPLTTARLRA